MPKRLPRRAPPRALKPTTIPKAILADRLAWLEAARAHADGAGEPPDPSLLVSGLGEDHAECWPIGLKHARAAFDPVDGSPYVEFTFYKPEKMATPSERPLSERRFDPEAAFILQAHLYFGGSISLLASKGSSGGRYHYPCIRIPKWDRIAWALRLVIDAPARRLGLQDSGGEFHDLRRRVLGRTITQEQAATKYGKGQRRPRLGRSHAIEASLNAWRSGLLAREAYANILHEGYALLDARPLQTQ